MKQVYLVVLLLANIGLVTSCDQEATTDMLRGVEELEGTWFRSYANKVWGGRDQPTFERGESHIRITFGGNGAFSHNRTVLGLYEGSSMDDTTAIFIESGTYAGDHEKVEVVLDTRIWWDSFYGEMVSFEESGVDPDKYRDLTYEISGKELRIEYYVETDIISDEQETPGLDKFEEVYSKQ